MSELKTLRSRGKLLLTGEYVILDGALSLAIPTEKGQSLDVYLSAKEDNKIIWRAYKHNGNLWHTCILDIKSKEIVETTDISFAETLLNILLQAKELNPVFFKKDFGYECETQLEFSEDWGFGTSSTLINNIAKWVDVDPYKLLKHTFGGSGYDIACANAETPITYQLTDTLPIVKEVYLAQEIADNVYFIYLNKKQNSREGIKQYRKREKSEELIKSITEITQEVIKPKCSFSQFSSLMIEHERLISDFIGLQTVKSKLFPDYTGFVKSLGAWGGDFVMVEKTENQEDYFQKKGYKVIKKYNDILV